jgi:hypothetical protein
MIIKARLKPLDQLPDSLLCCQGQRQSWASHANDIIEVDTSVVLLSSDKATCMFCGKLAPQVKAFRVVNGPEGVAGIPYFDLDEGVI